jgi:dipeptidyl aminopeptidase/acylaminoacyl peptidase
LQSLAASGGLDSLNVAHVYAFCVCFSADGELLAASDREQAVHIVDVATGKVKYRLKPDETEIYATAFSPDKIFVASGGNARAVHITDLLTRSVRSFAAQSSDIHGIAFSPDGRTLAATGDQNAVNLWEVVTGQIRMTLTGHSSTVNRVAFSPDGRLVATCSEDRTVRVWDSATGKQLRCFNGHLGEVYGVAFSPDGRTLASSSADTTVLIWDLSGLAVPDRTTLALHEFERNRFWLQLAGDNSVAAYAAIQKLAADPDHSVAYIRERVRATPRLDDSRLQHLLSNLNDDKYAVRERATDNLARLGEIAVPAMAKHLEGPISLESRRRIERLLAEVPSVPPREVVQTLRAIEVLEMIGTAEARQVIQSMVNGEPGARQTRDSGLALERMTKNGQRR